MNSDISIDDEVRQSAISRSDSISVLNESQGLIVENPDGTYLQGNFINTIKFLIKLKGVPSKFRKGQPPNEEGKENGGFNLYYL